MKPLPRSPSANLRDSKSLSYAAVPSATLVPNERQPSQYLIIPEARYPGTGRGISLGKKEERGETENEWNEKKGFICSESLAYVPRQ